MTTPGARQLEGHGVCVMVVCMDQLHVLEVVFVTVLTATVCMSTVAGSVKGIL